MSREWTQDEVRDKLIEHLKVMVRYWNSVDEIDTLEKLEGMAFSVLSMLDGCSMDVPGFIVAPCPHPDDKEYCKEEGENWFPQNHESEVNCDISGDLHEHFAQWENRKKKESK